MHPNKFIGAGAGAARIQACKLAGLLDAVQRGASASHAEDMQVRWMAWPHTFSCALGTQVLMSQAPHNVPLIRAQATSPAHTDTAGRDEQHMTPRGLSMCSRHVDWP